jgi:hypothetical protein
MTLNHRILTLGSCFSDAIGKRMEMCKFHTSVNPFGVSYNPISIHSLLNHGISNRPPSGDGYLNDHEVYHHYDFHSSLTALNAGDLEKILTEKINAAHGFIKAADWLVITYGSAWVYELVAGERIVANCHKMPGKLFRKRLLSEEEIISSFGRVYDEIKKVNSKIQIILTVSPVRHIKDTLSLNSVSKSLLRVVTHRLSTEYREVDYFPSYEIMMDDLRDYRFYKSDMIHPTEQAEDYIWKKFIECYFDEHARNFVNEWKGIQAALSHRAFHIHSAGHQNFLTQTISKLEQLKSTVDVSAEIAALRSQLKL